MRASGRRAGQVVVEMILVLPVFLTIVFSIMEIGYVSFQVIVLNHATYEVARIGGMTTPCQSGSCTADMAHLSTVMTSMLKNATVSCSPVSTVMDRQAMQQNFDLQCISHEKVNLIFPISSIILSDKGDPGVKTLSASVAMPIERPLQQ